MATDTMWVIERRTGDVRSLELMANDTVRVTLSVQSPTERSIEFRLTPAEARELRIGDTLTFETNVVRVNKGRS